MTVNGAGAGSVFTIDTGVAATLSGLTITGGYSVGFGQGGGISNQGTATLDDCTISGNSGDFGGGLGQNNQDASAVITDCTISGNSAQVSGGGLGPKVRRGLTDCIISGNSAGPSPRGLTVTAAACIPGRARSHFTAARSAATPPRAGAADWTAWPPTAV